VTVLPVTVTVFDMATPRVLVMVVIVNGLERLRTLRVRPVSVGPRMRVLVHTTAVSVSGCLHRVVENSSLLSLAQSFRNTGPSDGT